MHGLPIDMTFLTTLSCVCFEKMGKPRVNSFMMLVIQDHKWSDYVEVCDSMSQLHHDIRESIYSFKAIITVTDVSLLWTF